MHFDAICQRQITGKASGARPLGADGDIDDIRAARQIITIIDRAQAKITLLSGHDAILCARND